ncbi:MAG: hypothetical protein H6722_17805 [Sandaracinus sp.]|nr:hypothetical protein [Sandaracinus sp.]
MANDDEKRTPEDAEEEREAPEGTDEEQHDDAETDEDSSEDASDDSEEEGDAEGDDEDDEADDEDEDEEAAPAKSNDGAKKKTGRKHKGSTKISAGQRLAAAKAAKAAKKIAQRGKEAEVVEEEAIETAEVASSWLDRNRTKLLGAFAAVLLVGGLVFGIQSVQKKSAAEASGLLWEATEILNAPIRAEGEEAEEGADEDEPSYTSIASRADAALAKLDELFASHGDSEAAAWGHLEQGRALYQKGEHAEARAAFETALTQGGEALAPRALEGIAFTFESEENWDEAVARFEQLREEGGALQILADYHLARIHLAKDEEDPAKTKLQAVLEALGEEDAPELAYVRDQAELRLMAIDSSLVQRDAANQMDPAEMQRLIEQLTRQQQQQGGTP